MENRRILIEQTALQRGVLQGDAKTAHTCKRILKLKTALWTFVYTPGG